MAQRLAFVFAIVFAAVAAAATPDANTAAALEKFEAGRAAFAAGRLDEALIAFKSSNELLPSPNSRLYIGRCYRALGKLASAYTSFKLAAREARDRVIMTGEKRYAATRDAANAEAAEIEAQVPHLTIEVPADLPAALTVKKNGEVVPRAAWGLSVETDAGAVVIEAAAPRYAPFVERLELKPGESRRVRVEPRRLPTGTIAIHWRTRPAGASAEIDGAPIDVSQDSVHEVDPGPHVFTARAPGTGLFRWEQPVAPNQRAEVVVSFAAPTHSRRTIFRAVFYAAAAIGIAALVTGGALYGSAQRQNVAEVGKSPYDRSQATKDTIRTEAISASALFATGGVLAAGAAVLSYFAWRKEKPAAVSLRPLLSPTTTGLVLGGSF